MPAKKRFKTKYPSVYYIESKAIGSGKPERIYYIMYRKNGRLIEEKAGRQFQDDMTPARAAHIRAQRINDGKPSNRELREMGRKSEMPKWTIARLWEEYKIQTRLKGLAQDESRYRNHLAPHFAGKEPQNLVPLDIDRLRIKLLKAKSPQTVKNTLALLRRITRFGVRKGLCPPLGFTIEIPKVNNIKTEDLTPKEFSNLLEAVEADPDRDAGNIVKMALFTGMRRSEIFRLKWEDIDFEKAFIAIRDPKGSQDQKIPLNPVARELLTSIQKTESEYVFPGRNGGRRVEARNTMRIRDRAGLPRDFRPLHGLRHCYASMLASSGQIDMYTLQKLLTHKSAQMTQRYAHLRDEALKRAADIAGDLIEQAVNGKGQDKVAHLEKRKE